ncbi:MAG: dihydropteroate synthase [Actinobacteria bacterium]|nr:dihydropteroate synthase [Actinomycetota bacterium]
MAIVNRTPDSFFDKGSTFAFDAALERVDLVAAQGADLVDIGGVKAAPGDEVTVAEEIDRTIPLIEAVRARYPKLIISVDTWRHEVAQAACRAGADLLNDTWSGADPLVAEVAARRGVGLVCSHVGRARPRTRPLRVAYENVTADAIARTTDLAERAAALGVARSAVLIDPTHDFGKNTYHSLQLTRELDQMVATGWPVLVSLSNKDFVGETLGGLPVGERLTGTLAATAICAWHGARVFRAHDVLLTRQVLDMVASIKGDRPPGRAIRGLA